MADYIPNIASPVWYGAQNFVLNTGGVFRVLYPALPVPPGRPGHPAINPPLFVGLGKYKIVMFTHGQGTTYLSWDFTLSELARAGYIVIIPETNGESVLSANVLDVPLRAFDWVINNPESQFRNVVDLSMTGLCGHSYGGPVAAALALDLGKKAVYASIAGAFIDSETNVGHVDLTAMAMPKLFIIGGNAEVDPIGGGFDLNSNDAVDHQLWNMLPRPKHNLNFVNAAHLDYVPAGAPGSLPGRGPCSLVPRLTSDFLATFFTKYMAPQVDDSLGVYNNLVMEPVGPLQVQSYPVGFLTGLSAILENPRCGAISTWDLPPVPPSPEPQFGFDFFGVI
ncbi:MAG TPA: hypothetical protein VK716_02905 [Terracidiphilus sp.]|jgi:hypothetical protein|nr:hypothetical protein [Terracidiphilus sp.]